MPTWCVPGEIWPVVRERLKRAKISYKKALLNVYVPEKSRDAFRRVFLDEMRRVDGTTTTRKKKVKEGPMKRDITKAIKELKSAVKVVVEACEKKYDYVPEPEYDEEECEFIFGMNDEDEADDVHPKACQFLWDRGVGAPLLEFLGPLR